MERFEEKMLKDNKEVENWRKYVGKGEISLVM